MKVNSKTKTTKRASVVGAKRRNRNVRQKRSSTNSNPTNSSVVITPTKITKSGTPTFRNGCSFEIRRSLKLPKDPTSSIVNLSGSSSTISASRQFRARFKLFSIKSFMPFSQMRTLNNSLQDVNSFASEFTSGILLSIKQLTI
jgi:hypothetical protein